MQFMRDTLDVSAKIHEPQEGNIITVASVNEGTCSTPPLKGRPFAILKRNFATMPSVFGHRTIVESSDTEETLNRNIITVDVECLLSSEVFASTAEKL